MGFTIPGRPSHDGMSASGSKPCLNPGGNPWRGYTTKHFTGIQGCFFLAAEIFLVPAPCTVLSKLDRLVVWHHGSTIDHGTVPNEF